MRFLILMQAACLKPVGIPVGMWEALEATESEHFAGKMSL